MSIDFEEMCKLKAKDFDKITKAEMVEAIGQKGFYYGLHKSELNTFKENAKSDRTIQLMLCKLLAAWLGDEREMDQWGSLKDYECKDLLVLAGRVLAAAGPNPTSPATKE